MEEKSMFLKIFGFIFPRPHPSPRNCLAAAAGIIIGIGAISLLAYASGEPLLIAPFGASAVLIYAAKDSPLARPRNFIGGYAVSALVSITCCYLLPDTWFLIPIIVTLSILCMMVTDTVHPPGGAIALLCAMDHQENYFFLLQPLAIGVAILFVTAVLASRISKDMKYPYHPAAPDKKRIKSA